MASREQRLWCLHTQTSLIYSLTAETTAVAIGYHQQKTPDLREAVGIAGANRRMPGMAFVERRMDAA